MRSSKPECEINSIHDNSPQTTLFNFIFFPSNKIFLLSFMFLTIWKQYSHHARNYFKSEIQSYNSSMSFKKILSVRSESIWVEESKRAYLQWSQPSKKSETLAMVVDPELLEPFLLQAQSSGPQDHTLPASWHWLWAPRRQKGVYFRLLSYLPDLPSRVQNPNQVVAPVPEKLMTEILGRS